MNALETLAAKTPPFHRIVRLVGAGLSGFGLILWIAANWDSISRMQKFGLVGGALLVFAALAALVPAWRAAASLGAFLAIGGLFALFGQTYQTGADPWQLFALWAAVGLPLAVAARHDAALVPWTGVAYAALSLFYQQTEIHFDRPTGGLSLILSVWAIGFALLASLHLYRRSPLGAPAGRWATQLAGLLFAVIVCAGTLGAVFANRTVAPEYWIGLLVLAGMVLLAANLRPREFGQMALYALMLDIALIAGFWRLLETGHANAFTFLIVAIVAAGIVAATGWTLMRFAPTREKSAAGPSEAAGPTDDGRVDDGRVTWPVAVVSGIGALIAAIPFYVFLGAFFSDLFRSAPGLIALGAPMVAAALVGLRKSRPLGFLQQFAFIGLLTGLGLVAGGLSVLVDRLGSERFAWVFAAMALLTAGVAALNRVGWINVLLGWGGAGSAGLALFIELSRQRSAIEMMLASLSAVLLATVVALVFLIWNPHKGRARTDLSVSAERYLTGAASVSLLALMIAAGSTFLGGAFSPFGNSGAIPKLQDGWRTLQILSGVLAAAGGGLLLVHCQAQRLPLAWILAAAAVVFAAFSPNLGACVLLGAAFMRDERRALAMFAAIAALWIAGAFYYWLGWPLAHKAALLAALGLGLILASLLFAGEEAVPAGGAAHTAGLPRSIASGLILLSALAAAGIAFAGIRDNENIIANGRKIYIKLVPVDPRSLMQGDYMALRFEGGRMRDPRARLAKEQFARADLDARGIATPKAHAESRPAAGPGEIVFPLRWKNGNWIVATDAWYFKEGTGERFNKARFGEFRLRSDGRLLLVGMADENLDPIL